MSKLVTELHIIGENGNIWQILVVVATPEV